MSVDKWPLRDTVWERDRNAEKRLEDKRYLLISSEKSQLLGEFLHGRRGNMNCQTKISWPFILKIK